MELIYASVFLELIDKYVREIPGKFSMNSSNSREYQSFMLLVRQKFNVHKSRDFSLRTFIPRIHWITSHI